MTDDGLVMPTSTRKQSGLTLKERSTMLTGGDNSVSGDFNDYRMDVSSVSPKKRKSPLFTAIHRKL